MPCRGCWLDLNSNKHTRKVLQSAGQLNTCFPFVKNFRCENPGANVYIFTFEIGHFKAVCSVAQPLNGNEAGGDLALIGPVHTWHFVLFELHSTRQKCDV